MKLDHHPFYCEENVWRLVVRDDVPTTFRWVVFITNESRTCAFWHQRAAEDPNQPIVWDYHVVAIAEGNEGPIVWDLDCTFALRLPFEAWARVSFPNIGRLPAEYEPRFLLHEVDTFIEEFASDRRHMVGPEGEPYHPFPEWDAIGEGHNLDRWMDLESHPGLEIGDLHTYITAACGAGAPH